MRLFVCGAAYSRGLRRRHQDYGDRLFIYGVFLKINDKQRYLWCAVDQGGDVV